MFHVKHGSPSVAYGVVTLAVYQPPSDEGGFGTQDLQRQPLGSPDEGA